MVGVVVGDALYPCDFVVNRKGRHRRNKRFFAQSQPKVIWYFFVYCTVVFNNAFWLARTWDDRRRRWMGK